MESNTCSRYRPGPPAGRGSGVAAASGGTVERPGRPHEYAAIDGFEQTAAEVAAATNLSPVAASYLVSYAEALDTRLPKVAALLAEGRTDWRTVRLIISRSDLVTDEELITKRVTGSSTPSRCAGWPLPHPYSWPIR